MSDIKSANTDLSRLSGFWLQTGFVDVTVDEGLRFGSLQAAFEHVFYCNKENAILLCNGIPVCFSYCSDLPLMLPKILDCLDTLQQYKNLPNYELTINTRDVEAAWFFNLRNDVISINMKWLRVKGNYQAALNVVGEVSYNKHVFINEWLMLLKQCQQCLTDAGAVLMGEARVGQELLNKVEARIKGFGRFYQRFNSGRTPRLI